METYTTRASLLARLAVDGDDLAWQEFHLQYAGLIRRVALRRRLQAADCDDIVQDVLIRLARAMPGFEYDKGKGKFRGYLKMVILSAISDRFRQKKGPDAVLRVDHETAPVADPADADDVWEEEWRTYHVEKAMRVIEAEFNEKDRLAFEQYATSGRGVQETARSLDMSVDRVYAAKSRILKRLTELVAQQIEEEG
ncbi:MAG: sigma-70 family RNA polymerase sigma factor [bacterium]|nr:sigma-70 family RNA polymerase sigma factor [bacterium]